MVSLQIHPEKAKLAEEVGLLRDRLAHLLQEREELVSVVIPSLEALYYVFIGKYQYDCFYLECEVRRIKRKIEMIQGALNRMEPVDLVQIEVSLDIEQLSWKKLIDDMAEKLELAKEWAEAEALSVQAEKELKKLYYELAKKAHPDIHQNQSEHLNSIWLQIVSAYKSGNLEGMKALALLLENETEDLYALSTDILEAKREQLKKQMDQLAQVVTSLRQTFPYTIEDQIKDPNWVNAQVSEFLEKQKALSQQQGQLLVMLASLISGLSHDTQSHSH